MSQGLTASVDSLICAFQIVRTIRTGAQISICVLKKLCFPFGMHRAPLASLATYCDRLLQTGQFQDWDGAVNGLQVENSGYVRRLAAAVDGSLATIRMA